MTQYKVIALSVGGNSNKIYHSQQIVDESCFYPEHVQELIDGGFIEKIDTKPSGDYPSPDPEIVEVEQEPKTKKRGPAGTNKK